MKREYIIIDKTESLLVSFLRDFITFAFLVACMFISTLFDSNWWQVFCIGVFMIFFALKSATIMETKKGIFKDIQKAKEHLDSLEENE